MWSDGPAPGMDRHATNPEQPPVATSVSLDPRQSSSAQVWPNRAPIWVNAMRSCSHQARAFGPKLTRTAREYEMKLRIRAEPSLVEPS